MFVRDWRVLTDRRTGLQKGRLPLASRSTAVRDGQLGSADGSAISAAVLLRAPSCSPLLALTCADGLYAGAGEWWWQSLQARGRWFEPTCAHCLSSSEVCCDLEVIVRAMENRYVSLGDDREDHIPGPLAAVPGPPLAPHPSRRRPRPLNSIAATPRRISREHGGNSNICLMKSLRRWARYGIRDARRRAGTRAMDATQRSRQLRPTQSGGWAR
jgi:hypothetical protein